MAFVPGIQIPNQTGGSKEHASQYEPENGHWQVISMGFQRIGVISGCAVTAQGVPDQTVAVASGVIIDGVTERSVTGGNVTLEAADGTNPRFDLIMVNATTGALVNPTAGDGKGTAATNPVFPDITALTNRVILAVVRVPASDNTIPAAAITDLRVFIPKRPRARMKASSGTQADTGTGLQVVDFAGGTTVYDNDTMVDLANDRMIAKTAGVYSILGSVYWASTASVDGVFRLQLRLNGTTIIANTDEFISTGTHGVISAQQISAQYKLAVNDYIELMWESDSVSLSITGSTGSGIWLAMARVGDA